MADHYDDWDEAFRYQERKEQRKERKQASFKDRSQFKKSDLDQKRKRQEQEPPSGDFLEGRVLAILSEGILVDHQGKPYLCSLKGALKQKNIRTKNLVAVGDFVLFERQPLSSQQLYGTIAHIKERKSILSRADNLSRRKEQLIAVNIDQVLITCSVLHPPLKPPLIDRYIIAAQKGGMHPIIVINKIDLLDQSEEGLSLSDQVMLETEKTIYTLFLTTYRSLGIPVFPVSTTNQEGIDDLKKTMQGKASVFSGQSGVGKTSLINRLLDENFPVGHIVSHTLKGTHTTSTARLIPIEGGGFCIDTPGIRSFGLWDFKKEEIEAYFPEIFEFGAQCRYPDCSHLQEPDCAVQKALEEGKISPLRFESYCALMADLSEEHRHR
jgi:ribosome biogenesis GTPase / thiamine phosphate phosphatase